MRAGCRQIRKRLLLWARLLARLLPGAVVLLALWACAPKTGAQAGRLTAAGETEAQNPETRSPDTCQQEAGAQNALPLENRIRNLPGIILALRQGLKSCSAELVIRFTLREDILEELKEAVPVWMERAMDETGDPAEGDYIRMRTGGFRYTCARTDAPDGRHYEVTVTPEYYSYASQEEAVDRRAGELLAELGLSGDAPDEEKIRAVYLRLCRDVRYDRVHRKNPHRHLKSTAYSALVLGTATCQGYCAALYRLLTEEGIECRIVTGRADSEELHAWVLARLGEQYYLLDPTRDAGKEQFSYFLLGRRETGGYVPDERYRDEAFSGRYPLAEHAYRTDAAQGG